MSEEINNQLRFLVEGLLKEVRRVYGQEVSYREAYDYLGNSGKRIISKEEWNSFEAVLAVPADPRTIKTTEETVVVTAEAEVEVSTTKDRLIVLLLVCLLLSLAVGAGQVVMGLSSEPSLADQISNQQHLINAVQLLPSVDELRTVFPDFDHQMQNENFRRAVFVAVHMTHYPQAFAESPIEYWSAVYDYQRDQFNNHSLQPLDVQELINFIDYGQSPNEEFTYFSDILSAESGLMPFAQYYFITEEILKPDTAQRVSIIIQAGILNAEVKFALAKCGLELDDLAAVAREQANYYPSGRNFVDRVRVAAEKICGINVP